MYRVYFYYENGNGPSKGIRTNEDVVVKLSKVLVGAKMMVVEDISGTLHAVFIDKLVHVKQDLIVKGE